MTMQRRPFGCLTGIALVFGTLTVILLVAAALATANGIFAPGPLNAEKAETALHGISSHADLAGRCDACHAQAWSAERMADKCLACHESVGDELAAGTGLHGRFATSGQCRGCHTEHGGTTASLTVANPATFPHAKTGFWLDAHPVAQRLDAFTCADCHQDSVSKFTASSCQTCHTEEDPAYMAEHVDAFGTGCRNCHDGIDTYGADFAHASWKLEGKHADTSCAMCHAGDTTILELQDTSTACISCHAKEDIHERRLGSDCASCHTAATWEEAPDDFDHDQTTFALKGGHTEVECLGCHVDRAWTGIGTTCESCHAADDPHNGQFDQPCASCHTESDWKETTFDHATTRFALVDAHAKPECSACHADGKFTGTPMTCYACHKADDEHKGNVGKQCEECHVATTWADTTFTHAQSDFHLTGAHTDALCVKCHATLTEYRGTPTTCFACHKDDDEHKGEFGTDCASCHNTRDWDDVTFDHAKTDFPLTGAHRSATCSKCHTDSTFKNTPTSCVSCHRADDAHNGSLGTNCAKCHSTRAWEPATFDHATTGFKLTGAHVSTTCRKCHTSTTYANVPSTCYGCHKQDDEHNGGFGTKCNACHTTRSWSGATVDHSKTDFPLTGAHKSVSCAKCHKNNVYSGTPTACNACHSKPSTHQPDSFSACRSCHTTGAWKPADFNQAHSFPMGHRNADGVCSKCHTGSWAVYTCSRCHSDTKMNEKHREVSGFSLNTCAKCHPKGEGD